MTRRPRRGGLAAVGAAALAVLALASVAAAQMVTGSAMPGYKETFGLDKRPAKGYAVEQIGVVTPTAENANVLWPGEKATFTFRLTNHSDQPLKTRGKVCLVEYATKGLPGDMWVPRVFKVADRGATPVDVDLPAKGSAEFKVAPAVPERFGGYALVFDLGERGRAFGAGLVRVPKADPARVQYPTLGIDMVWPHELSEATWTVRERVGAKACRWEVGYFPTTADDFDRRMADLTRYLAWAQDHHFAVMLFIGAGGPQPLGRPRPHLDDKGNLLDTKSDMAWLPAYDEDFQKWVKMLCLKFGWPKGPVNGIELWNEPWEGISISGWGADMIRYREIYTRMAQGIEEARKEAGVEVLIGGTCSSSNTLDKFFSDGSDRFLKWLDFTSIHYQPMSAAPSLDKKWMSRESPNGRVRVWDTESWIANSDDRVAVVMASMRAQGQDRANGIYAGNCFYQTNKEQVAGAYPPAAALAAGQHFIAERPFRQLLFTSGLPWVFVFDGRLEGKEPRPDDGTVVVVGDLSGMYERERLLFRGVLGLENFRTGAPVLEGGSLTIDDAGGRFRLFDFYANPVACEGGRITVPLNGLGYFLRTDGSKGSFEALLAALRAARIEGYEPLDVVAHDLLAPIAAKPALRLTLTNILNRPVSGKLAVTLGDLTLTPAGQELKFEPHETREVAVKVSGGKAVASNTYPLSVAFDAGKDGKAVHSEELHVNVIARRDITVDGKLDDWTDALPQTVAAGTQKPSLTEQAWLPFAKWDVKVGKGFASAYLACDATHFYFAAKIADETPDEGTLRFETRDEDADFYPETCSDKGKPLVWPQGVRRYSYRRNPVLPAGNAPSFDNVQIAFNVIAMDSKPWAPNPPGTMPRFMCYWDTDYEYALNAVAPAYGGGVEIWRLLVPGMPRKHFYPRQPKSPLDGPVKDGKLVVRRDGAMRLVEAALPWAEMPEVKKRLDAGQTIRFSFRVNDNGGPGYELAAGRSVSKINFPAFHADWVTHWANELEFAFEP